MNETVNKFLSTGDRFMPKLYYDSQDLLIVLVDYLLSIVRGF